jgi:putative transposase
LEELQSGSLSFEQRHNNKYRYRKIKGEPPQKALAASNVKLRFPTIDDPPKYRQKKPEIGNYRVVRLIRSDMKLNVFGECFSVPPETMIEYVEATIDVKEQKMKLFLDKDRLRNSIIN